MGQRWWRQWESIRVTLRVRLGVERRPQVGSPSTRPSWRSITRRVGGIVCFEAGEGFAQFWCFLVQIEAGEEKVSGVLGGYKCSGGRLF